MASQSMAEVYGTSTHYHHNEALMNTSLTAFTQVIVKQLANQSIHTRDTCGQIQMGLVRVAVKTMLDKDIRSNEIAPHILLTSPCWNHQLQMIEHFSNSENTLTMINVLISGGVK